MQIHRFVFLYILNSVKSEKRTDFTMSFLLNVYDLRSKVIIEALLKFFRSYTFSGTKFYLVYT